MIIWTRRKKSLLSIFSWEDCGWFSSLCLTLRAGKGISVFAEALQGLEGNSRKGKFAFASWWRLPCGCGVRSLGVISFQLVVVRFNVCAYVKLRSNGVFTSCLLVNGGNRCRQGTLSITSTVSSSYKPRCERCRLNGVKNIYDRPATYALESPNARAADPVESRNLLCLNQLLFLVGLSLTVSLTVAAVLPSHRSEGLPT